MTYKSYGSDPPCQQPTYLGAEPITMVAFGAEHNA